MVWQVRRALPKTPIIGLGGIMTAEDAAEFLLCGADAVQLGTVNYVNPKAPLEVIEGLKRYLSERKLRRPAELTGRLQVPGRLRGVPRVVSG